MNNKTFLRFLITLLIGSAGGLTAYTLRIPAGALLGSMLAVGIYNCLGFKAFMPSQVRIGARILVGTLLGLSLNPDSIIDLTAIALIVWEATGGIGIGPVYFVSELVGVLPSVV